MPSVRHAAWFANAAEAPTPAGDTGYVNDVNVGLASADVTRRSTRQATNEALFCACTPH